MYRVTVRRGPKVERSTHEALDDALTVVEADARTAPRRAGVEFLSRHYAPGDVVAVRIELKGPRLRAGVDVRGDGDMVAWTGRLRRATIEQEPGESALAALRRTLVTRRLTVG
jgi:hypothetical protein